MVLYRSVPEYMKEVLLWDYLARRNVTYAKMYQEV